jgi:hypothetical protein
MENTVEYTMRPLKTMDIFKMSKILKKLNVKLDVDEKITQKQMGAQIIQRVVENLHLAENEVNAFLAELVGIDAKNLLNYRLRTHCTLSDCLRSKRD